MIRSTKGSLMRVFFSARAFASRAFALSSSFFLAAFSLALAAFSLNVFFFFGSSAAAAPPRARSSRPRETWGPAGAVGPPPRAAPWRRGMPLVMGCP